MNFDWHNEKRRIKDLVPYVANPRQITEKQAKDLKASLDKFGVADPIIINTDNTIIGGHQRKKILETLMGVDPDYEIDVRVPDRELSIDEMRELNVRLNKNQGEWNFDTLANNFELDDLLDWGFEKSDLDLDLWMPEAPEDAEPQIDRAEELREIWGVETGQLWQLGSHRLICGDCTDKAVVERMMGGETARLCFTSPPYGNLRDYETGDIDFQKLYREFISIVFGFCDDVLVNLGIMHKDGAVYRYWEEWLDYCEKINNSLYGLYIWDQGEGYPGDYHGRLARSFEFVFHFSKNHLQANKWIPTLYTPEDAIRERAHHRNNPRTGSRQKDGSIAKFSADKVGQSHKIPDSVIRINREKARGIHTESHPATFPQEFAEFILNTWSNDADNVYEPFAGSGTTLIACERLNRKCRAIEISPAYVAVAIQRWVDVTGGTPLLIDED